MIDRVVLYERRGTVVSMNGDTSDYPTAHDLAVIANFLMGQGVKWQVSRELAKKLNLPFNQVNDALNDVLNGFSKMSAEDAKADFDDLCIQSLMAGE